MTSASEHFFFCISSTTLLKTLIERTEDFTNDACQKVAHWLRHVSGRTPDIAATVVNTLITSQKDVTAIFRPVYKQNNNDNP
jgi:hypothetical protein